MAHQPTIDWYDENAKGFAKSSDLVSHEDMLDYFVNLVKQGKVLDVGCGSGRDSIYLHSKGFEVDGIDASSELTDIAKTKEGNIKYTNGDFLNLPYPDRSFDGVWAHASIIHVESKNEFLLAIQEISRVLKTDGYAHFLLIPRLPNDTKISYFNKGFFDGAKEQSERVFYRTDEDEITNLLCQNHFEIVHDEVFEEGVRYPARRMGIWWMWIVARRKKCNNI